MVTTTTTTIAAMMNDGGNRNTTQKNAAASRSSKKRRRMLLFVMIFAVTFLQLLLITATITTTTKTTKEYTVYNTNPIICSYRPFESFNPVGYIKANIGTKQSSSSHHHHHNKKFAYAFVVAGCTSSSLTSSSSSLSSCQAYILNAIVASTVLKNYNSTSDILFCVRMASSSSSDRLSCEEEQMLQMAGIQLYYLPKIIIRRRKGKGAGISKNENGEEEEEEEEVENFGTITLEKFRVLEMTKYERVYFLDADLIPLCNIDYHMELSYNNNRGGSSSSSSSSSSSDSAVLQQYVGMQGSREPINTGSFIVTPKDGLFDNVLNIVHRHREKDIEPQVFNPIHGWGHTIMNDENDRWYASEVNGLLWNFHGFQVDQGIMYYWLKYEMRNWSHILENGEIDTWRDISSWTDEDKVINKVNPIKVTKNQYIALVNKSKAYQINNNNNNNNYNTGCRGHLHGRNKGTIKGLALDMYHYKGKEKPWLEPIIADSIPATYSTNLKGRDVWLYWLGVANTTLGIKLPDRIDISSSSSSSSGGDGRGPTVLDWKSDRNMLLQPGIELPRPTPRGG